MADDDQSSKFRLDLDTDSFQDKAGGALEAIQKVGAGANLEGLADALVNLSPLLGAVTVAFFALKEGFDAAFDKELLDQMNQEFETLAGNAGIMSDKLKDGLLQSAHGWADEKTLIEAANKAMVEMVTGAKELPEIMELAHKATLVFGGTITQNFERMTNAIATGRTIELKQLGIVIDQKKAQEEYAKSIGETVSSLSMAGQQQAILNQVLSQGKEKFKAINDDLEPATNAWRQFKSSLADTWDTLQQIVGAKSQGSVASFFGSMKFWLDDITNTLKAHFGSGIDKVKGQIGELNQSIEITKRRIADVEQKKKIGLIGVTEADQSLKSLNENLAGYQKQLDAASQAEAKAGQEKNAGKGPSGSSQASQAQMVDLDKQKQQRAQYDQSIAALDKAVLQAQLQNMTSVAEATKLYHQKQLQEVEAIDAKKAEVRAKEASGELTRAQATQEMIRLNKMKDLAMQQDDQALRKMQQQALDNYVAHSKTAFDGVARGFQSMSEKNKIAMKDWGQFGDKTAQTFGTHMTSMFQQIGSGSKSATDALKDAFAGMIADVATNYGQMMMLASIFPFDPPVFAAGAALVALGGFLGGVAGASPSSAAGSAASSGGAVSGSGSPTANPANPTTSTPTPGNQSTTSPSQVNLIIQGHMITNDQTAKWLTDQIRSASDTTDFTIQRVGGGV